ncbi:SDR family NAD(P)-dependent oxidoreductase [Candidatus Roizmanbacteria bacterium]|nr:SDR family NAD(P)-dependent oxidoreductase [Candidatus Roizmanbacteria bacterium]
MGIKEGLSTREEFTNGIEQKERLLEGKVAVVTGTSRGIGAATAKLLARHGAIIFGLHRDPGKEGRANDIVGEIEGQGGIMYSSVVDITKNDQITQFTRRLGTDFGVAVNIVVHNAAGGLERGATDEDAWNINNLAKQRLTRSLRPLLASRSLVIDITSIWSTHYGEVPPLEDYEPVAKSKLEGERKLEVLVSFLKIVQQKNIGFGVVCGHVISDTATYRLMELRDRRRPEGEVKTLDTLRATAYNRQFATPSDMAAAVLNLATVDQLPDSPVYVGVDPEYLRSLTGREPVQIQENMFQLRRRD